MSEIENGNQEATAPAGNSVDDILATFDLEFGSESQTQSQGTPPSEGSSETPGDGNSEPSSPASDTSSEGSGSTGSESTDSTSSTSSTATSPVEPTSTTQEGAAGQQQGTSNGTPAGAPAPSDAELRTLMMQILQNQQNLQNQKSRKGNPTKGNLRRTRTPRYLLSGNLRTIPTIFLLSSMLAYLAKTQLRKNGLRVYRLLPRGFR